MKATPMPHHQHGCCHRLATAVGVLAALLAPQAQAAPDAAAARAGVLRSAIAPDPQTLDPHALALMNHTRVAHPVHETLVGRDAQFEPEPALALALALSWQNTGPRRWRFKMRPGVAFHDGAPCAADDAVLSIERVTAPTSLRAFPLRGVGSVRKIEALSIEFVLEARAAGCWPRAANPTASG